VNQAIMELNIAPDYEMLPVELTQGLEHARLIISGESSESTYHSWVGSFYLLHSADRTRYGLRFIDQGDPDNQTIWDEDEEDYIDNPDYQPYEAIVAVISDLPTSNENWIAWFLMHAYRKAGGKYIEFVDEVGEFDLDRGRQIHLEEGFDGSATDSPSPTTA
jgi:hypothetical protein